MIFLKALIILLFGIIFWQDYKDRMVYWFWYPIIAVLGFFIQKEFLDSYLIFISTAINLLLILTVVSILWIYSKLILKRRLINGTIGLGDILFFVFLTFCFSVISFFVLFVFSLLFSLLLHFFFKNKNTNYETIPLAGYMSVFFAIVYATSFFVNCNFIFAY